MTLQPLSIDCIVRSHDLVGESPLWHPEHELLYWTDINGFQVKRHSPRLNDQKTWGFKVPVSTLSLTSDPDWLLLAGGGSLMLWSPATDERIPFVEAEKDWPHNRLNDGATDPAGVFWVGSMGNNIAPDGREREVEGMTGSLYRVSPEGEVGCADTHFGITNTVVWSPDHSTFYCGDSSKNVIYAYDYTEKDSSIRNRRVLVEHPGAGVPDGSAVDADGNLWNCRFYGSSILRISPGGKILESISLPVSNITNCIFGGSDLRTLYITTASLQTKTPEPLAGNVFAMRTSIRGLPPSRFALRKQKLENLRAAQKAGN